MEWGGEGKRHLFVRSQWLAVDNVAPVGCLDRLARVDPFYGAAKEGRGIISQVLDVPFAVEGILILVGPHVVYCEGFRVCDDHRES